MAQPSCGSDGCYKCSGATFGVLTIIGIALLAAVVDNTPSDNGTGCSLDCKSECLHGDEFGDAIRKMCCDGLEDCGPRVAKWVTGWILLITGLIAEIIVGSCLCSPCCRKEDKAPQATAAPVVQAQAVEVSLQPNTTV